MRKQDVLGTLRFLRQQPLFAGAIVGMLALGIGATTALWSVVYGVLLKPLPFPNADRIVEVWGAKPSSGWDRVSLTEANFWDMADMNHVFAEFGARHGASAILLGGDAPEQVTAAFVSSGFFRSLGVQPVAGRLFSPADDAPGDRERLVLLSHALWMRRYGGNPAIVGQTISLGSGPRTVIGVLPAGSPWLDSAQLFVPFQRRPDAERGSFEYTGDRSAQAGGVDGGRARGSSSRRGQPRASVSRAERGSWRHARSVERVDCERRSAARALDAAFGRRPAARHRLRQRDEPAARAGDRARA